MRGKFQISLPSRFKKIQVIPVRNPFMPFLGFIWIADTQQSPQLTILCQKLASSIKQDSNFKQNIDCGESQASSYPQNKNTIYIFTLVSTFKNCTTLLLQSTGLFLQLSISKFFPAKKGLMPTQGTMTECLTYLE